MCGEQRGTAEKAQSPGEGTLTRPLGSCSERYRRGIMRSRCGASCSPATLAMEANLKVRGQVRVTHRHARSKAVAACTGGVRVR